MFTYRSFRTSFGKTTSGRPSFFACKTWLSIRISLREGPYKNYKDALQMSFSLLLVQIIMIIYIYCLFLSILLDTKSLKLSNVIFVIACGGFVYNGGILNVCLLAAPHCHRILHWNQQPTYHLLFLFLS